jgi:3',5'-nucleoside bisphosphate phosphatase
LKGLEVFTSYHNDKASLYYQGLASELQLIPSAGSDFHGRLKPNVPFGSIRAAGVELVELLKSCRGTPQQDRGRLKACS